MLLERGVFFFKKENINQLSIFHIGFDKFTIDQLEYFTHI
jgi:hypothetical protein